MNVKNKQIHAMVKKCIHHRRTLGPEDDGPKMADGMPLGISIVHVMNCPTCDNYKKCRRMWRIKEQDFNKHKRWIENYNTK